MQNRDKISCVAPAPHPMGDEGGMTPIAKARCEPVNEPDGLIRRAEKKDPLPRSPAPAVERGHEFASARPSERHPGRATLCGHRGAPSVRAQLVLTKQVLPVQRPRCTPVRERCGLVLLWRELTDNQASEDGGMAPARWSGETHQAPGCETI